MIIPLKSAVSHDPLVSQNWRGLQLAATLLEDKGRPPTVSVQLVHLFLHGGSGGPAWLGHALGHDVPLGGHGLGLGTCRETGC